MWRPHPATPWAPGAPRTPRGPVIAGRRPPCGAGQGKKASGGGPAGGRRGGRQVSGARGSCCIVPEMGRGRRAEPASALAALAPVAKFQARLLVALSTS